jgi:small neutral amino acid transporter SnatA (MarC family)
MVVMGERQGYTTDIIMVMVVTSMAIMVIVVLMRTPQTLARKLSRVIWRVIERVWSFTLYRAFL